MARYLTTGLTHEAGDRTPRYIVTKCETDPDYVEPAAYRPFDDGVAAGILAIKTENGTAYAFPGDSASGLYYNRALSLDYIKVGVTVKIPSILQAQGRHLSVNFMNTLVCDSYVNVVEPTKVSGLAVYFYTSPEGKTIADAQIFKNGQREQVGGAVTVLSNNSIGDGTALSVTLKKEGNGWRLVYGDGVQSGLITGLDSIFLDGKAYLTTGLTHEASDVDHSVRYIVTDPETEPSQTSPEKPNESQEQEKPGSSASSWKTGGWKGYFVEPQYHKDGVCYVQPSPGAYALIYEKGLPMDGAGVTVKLEQTVDNGGWLCVNFMDKPVFNVGNPAQASGVILLIMPGENGALRADSFIYKDGKETYGGSVTIASKAPKAGDTVQVRLARYGEGWRLTVDGEAILINGTESTYAQLNGLYPDGLGHVVVGLNGLTEVQGRRFVITALEGADTPQTGDSAGTTAAAVAAAAALGVLIVVRRVKTKKQRDDSI